MLPFPDEIQNHAAILEDALTEEIEKELMMKSSTNYIIQCNYAKLLISHFKMVSKKLFSKAMTKQKINNDGFTYDAAHPIELTLVPKDYTHNKNEFKKKKLPLWSIGLLTMTWSVGCHAFPRWLSREKAIKRVAHKAMYMIDNRTIYCILDSICKKTDLHPYVKQFSWEMNVEHSMLSMCNGWAQTIKSQWHQKLKQSFRTWHTMARKKGGTEIQILVYQVPNHYWKLYGRWVSRIWCVDKNMLSAQ